MQIKKNLIFNTLLSISSVLMPLVTFPYASRILKPKGMGTVAYVDSFVQFFILLAALGIPVYGVREVAKYKVNRVELSKLFSELIIIHSFSVVIFLTCFATIVYLNSELWNHLDLCIIGGGLLILSIFPVEWLFQGLEEFHFIVIRTLTLRLVSILALFILVKTENDLFFYYGLNFITSLLNCIINFYSIRKKIIFVQNKLEFRKHIKPLIYIVGSSIAISAYVMLDSIILGTLTNTISVGYYTAAVKISKIPVTITGALSAVLIPQLSIAYSNNDYTKAYSLLRRSFDYIFFLGIPIAITLLLLAPDLLLIFAGVHYLPAANVLKVLAPLSFLLGLSNIFGLQILTPLGKEKLVFFSVTIGMVCSVAGNIILIPLYKHIGAGIVNIGTEFIVTTITALYANKYMKLQFPLKSFVACILSSISFIVIYYLIKSCWNVSNFIFIICNSVIYLGIYFLLQIIIFNSEIAREILNTFRMTLLKRKLKI